MKGIRVASLVLLLIACRPATAGAQTTKDVDQTARGRLVRVQPDEHRVTLRTREGKEMVLLVGTNDRLLVRGKVAELADFREGQRVRVRYAERDGKNDVSQMMTPPESLGGLRKSINQTIDALRTYAYDRREAYAEKLRDLLEDVDDEIDLLQERAASLSGEARLELVRTINDLQKRRAVVRAWLPRLRDASPAIWNDVRDSAVQALGNLRGSYLQALEQFQTEK